MQLDSNAHSVFLLYYHLALVVKYRRKVFDDNISDRAKEIFEYIAPISKFINAYKSADSRLLKKEFPQIWQKLCFLESELLPACNRRGTNRSYQKIYRKPG